MHPIVVADLQRLALAALAAGPQQVFAVVTREAIRLRPFNSAPDTRRASTQVSANTPQPHGASDEPWGGTGT